MNQCCNNTASTKQGWFEVTRSAREKREKIYTEKTTFLLLTRIEQQQQSKYACKCCGATSITVNRGAPFAVAVAPLGPWGKAVIIRASTPETQIEQRGRHGSRCAAVNSVSLTLIWSHGFGLSVCSVQTSRLLRVVCNM